MSKMDTLVAQVDVDGFIGYIGMVNYGEVGYQNVPSAKSLSREDLMRDCMEMWRGGQVRGKRLGDSEMQADESCRSRQRRFQFYDDGCCRSGKVAGFPWR